MINMNITVLNSDEQDLMNSFFAAQPKARAKRPRLTQQQLNT